MAIFPGFGFGAELVKSYPVIDGVNSIEEGLALTFAYPFTNGVAKVQVGSTSSTDQFAGIAYYQYRVLPTKLNAVQVSTVPATGPFTISIAKTPFAPATEIRVVVTSPLGVNTVLAYAGAASATEFAVSGQVVTLHSSFAGFTATITYSYTPSAVEARTFFGDVRPGISNTSSLGVINAIYRGVIVTTNYDPAADWAANSAVKILANGYLSKTSSGMAIPNAIVKEVPSVGKPYLTVELR